MTPEGKIKQIEAGDEITFLFRGPGDYIVRSPRVGKVEAVLRDGEYLVASTFGIFRISPEYYHVERIENLTPEGKVKEAFVDEARKVGLRYINLIETGDDGNPDKIALPPGGVPAFIEFKRPGRGTLSAAQIDKIRKYRSLGYRVYIISTKPHAVAIARGLREFARLDVPTEGHFLEFCDLKYDEYLSGEKNG